MIHIYDASSVAGKKAFHSLQKFFEFLECNVGADNACVCSMYLDRVAVSIYIENTFDRDLYRGTVGDQLDVSGVLRLSDLDSRKNLAELFRIKGLQQIVGCLYVVTFDCIRIAACNEDQSCRILSVAKLFGSIHAGHVTHINIHDDQVIKFRGILLKKASALEKRQISADIFCDS